jgi:hypothetical protein
MEKSPTQIADKLFFTQINSNLEIRVGALVFFLIWG